MTERLEFEMHNRQQAWLAVKGQLFPFLATVLQGGGRWVLTVTRRKRTQPQNRRPRSTPSNSTVPMARKGNTW